MAPDLVGATSLLLYLDSNPWSHIHCRVLSSHALSSLFFIPLLYRFCFQSASFLSHTVLRNYLKLFSSHCYKLLAFSSHCYKLLTFSSHCYENIGSSGCCVEVAATLPGASLAGAGATSGSSYSGQAGFCWTICRPGTVRGTSWVSPARRLGKVRKGCQ